MHYGSNYTLLGMRVTKAGWCRRRGGPGDWQQCQVAPSAGQIITVAVWQTSALSFRRLARLLTHSAKEMAEDSTGRRNEFIHTLLVPRG